MIIMYFMNFYLRKVSFVFLNAIRDLFVKGGHDTKIVGFEYIPDLNILKNYIKQIF